MAPADEGQMVAVGLVPGEVDVVAAPGIVGDVKCVEREEADGVERVMQQTHNGAVVAVAFRHEAEMQPGEVGYLEVGRHCNGYVLVV